MAIQQVQPAMDIVGFHLLHGALGAMRGDPEQHGLPVQGAGPLFRPEQLQAEQAGAEFLQPLAAAHIQIQGVQLGGEGLAAGARPEAGIVLGQLAQGQPMGFRHQAAGQQGA